MDNRIPKRCGLVAAILAVGLSLGACQTTGPNQTGGTLLGAAAGGLLGSQFGSGSGRLAATALGTVVGAGIGSSVGESLDRSQTYAPRPSGGRVVNNYYYYDDDDWRYHRHPRHPHRHW